MNTNKSKKRSSTVNLAVTSVLAAIIVIMTFTPLGYLNIGIVEITFLTIPVAVGAIICGPACGAFLGGVFGLTSFLQCFGIGRPSAFGAALLSINPVATGILCLVPRISAGLLARLQRRFCLPGFPVVTIVCGFPLQSSLTLTVPFLCGDLHPVPLASGFRRCQDDHDRF